MHFRCSFSILSKLTLLLSFISSSFLNRNVLFQLKDKPNGWIWFIQMWNGKQIHSILCVSMRAQIMPDKFPTYNRKLKCNRGKEECINCRGLNVCLAWWGLKCGYIWNVPLVIKIEISPHTNVKYNNNGDWCCLVAWILVASLSDRHRYGSIFLIKRGFSWVC